MKVRSFAFIGHPVQDLQRARDFYERVLGFPPPTVIDGSLNAPLGWLEYEIGPHVLAITTSWENGQPPRNPSSGLVLEVEDFHAAIDHLRAHRIPLEMGPFEGRTCSIAVILDPDGNRIGLHHLK